MQIVRERLDLDLSDYANLDIKTQQFGDELLVSDLDDEKTEKLLTALFDVLTPIYNSVKEQYLQTLLEYKVQRIRGQHWNMYLKKPSEKGKYKISSNTPKEFTLSVQQVVAYDEAIEEYKRTHNGKLPDGVKEVEKKPTIGLRRDNE